MRKPALILLFLLVRAGVGWAATTPLDTPFPAGGKVTIECEYAGKESSATPGTYHYEVHLPRDNGKNKDRRYPAIFILSPGGNRMSGIEQAVATAVGHFGWRADSCDGRRL